MFKQLCALMGSNKLNLIGIVLAVLAVIALSYHHPIYAFALSLFAIGCWTVRLQLPASIDDLSVSSLPNVSDNDIVALWKKMSPNHQMHREADEEMVAVLNRLREKYPAAVLDCSTYWNANLYPESVEPTSRQFINLELEAEQTITAALLAENEKIKNTFGKIEDFGYHSAEEPPVKKSTRKSKK